SCKELAAVSTFCRVAVSEGMLANAVSELKNELIAVPRTVELAELGAELRLKTFSICFRADSSAPDCACVCVCCCTCCSRTRSLWDVALDVTPAPKVLP